MSDRRRKGKSKIDRMPSEVKEAIHTMLRDPTITLAALIAKLQERFPEVEPPSVSGLHRYAEGFDEMMEQMRSFDDAARVVVGELGDSVGEKASGLLVHAMTTVATAATMRARRDKDLSIDEARKLAQMAKATMDARRLSFNERKAIRQEAREEALRAAAARVDSAAQARGLSADDARFWREQVLQGM